MNAKNCSAQSKPSASVTEDSDYRDLVITGKQTSFIFVWLCWIVVCYLRFLEKNAWFFSWPSRNLIFFACKKQQSALMPRNAITTTSCSGPVELKMTTETKRLISKDPVKLPETVYPTTRSVGQLLSTSGLTLCMQRDWKKCCRWKAAQCQKHHADTWDAGWISWCSFYLCSTGMSLRSWCRWQTLQSIVAKT